MKAKHLSKSAAVRARLDHPIIDSDGHQVEFGPIFLDFLKEVGGASVADRYKKGTGIDPIFAGGWRELTPAQRNDRRAMRPTWWACLRVTLAISPPPLSRSCFTNACLRWA
jgi:hypothetical protein